MSGEMAPQRLVDAPIQQDTHLAAGEQRLPCFFQSMQGHLPADSWKTLQKALQAMSGFEVVEEGAHQDSRTSKGGLARHNPGIANDYRFHYSSVPQFGLPDYFTFTHRPVLADDSTASVT